LINIDGGGSIPDAPRVRATMKIIYNGPGVRNALTDQNNASALNYNGRIEIEIRGSSSQFLEKKQYGLTTLMADNVTNNNVSLLGMPEENDWVLNALPFDASLVRDHISYTLSRSIGEYAPRTVYCEVLVNGNYRGLYMLQEKIKVDDNRVDIVKMDQDDNTLPDITGGYIIKADKITSEDPSAWTMASYPGGNVDFVYEFPKPGSISPQQSGYIKSVFQALESAAQLGNTSISAGYPSIIDVPSFVNFMLVNELAANVDAYQFSTFFHKDKNGKLRAGPLWDLNLTYGNDLFHWGLDRSKTSTWQFDNGDNTGARFWRDLFSNPTYKCYLSKRWSNLTQAGQPLNTSIINTLIDETVNHISEAVVREQSRWGTVGDHTSRIIGIKNFLTARYSWMTSILGSYSSCSNIATPPLVITKIHYNPQANSQFSSSDQEFIEIVNTGSEPIDMTGVYFSGTGFVYQFPKGYMFPPQGMLQLANKLEVFDSRYGFPAFAQFTRSLSNDGQKLSLADGFGNVIDEVNYGITAPWPEASANGFYIKLKDVSLDNHVGTNWVASNEPLTTNVIAGLEDNLTLEVFPNPTEHSIQVNSNQPVTSIQIHDIHGRVIESQKGSWKSQSINTRHLLAGVYIILIKTANKTVTKRFTKL
jgi:hypothetical protein